MKWLKQLSVWWTQQWCTHWGGWKVVDKETYNVPQDNSPYKQQITVTYLECVDCGKEKLDL